MTDGSKSSLYILSKRAQYLFKVLVERYISEGQPVGSRTLARDAGLDLSPATIRNVMADLEEMGLIRAPHTSAGRMPTVRGYRLFVDTLLTVKQPLSSEIQRIWNNLGASRDTQSLIKRASTLLSEVTCLAGIVMLPRTEQQALTHVEFLPLSDKRVLVILVINTSEVQNRIIYTERDYTSAELQQAANYLNQAFRGRELSAVRDKLLKEMRVAREAVDRMMQTAIEMAQQVFEPGESREDYVLAGQTNLMGMAEFDIDQLRQLFEAFNQKRDILHLLDQALSAQGMQIFIGEESGYSFLDDCSVVTSTYQADGRVLGVLGVIGPTRMSYERVIPIVDLTAKILGSALKSLH
jgi:heat-inducible transcriptional repressor